MRWHKFTLRLCDTVITKSTKHLEMVSNSQPQSSVGVLRWGALYLVASSHQQVYIVFGEMSTLNHLLFLKSKHQNVGSAMLGVESELVEMREINSL